MSKIGKRAILLLLALPIGFNVMAQETKKPTLEELIPGEKREHLIMYYLQIKDAMEKGGTQDFDEAVKRINPKNRIISVNKTIHQYYKAVMEADADIKEDLELPTAEEIKKRERGAENGGY